MKTSIDYDYEIVAAHERLNRLLPIRNATDTQLVEIADVYKHINALVENKKALSQWHVTDYDMLVKNSKEGRERLAIYPYPNNPYDTISAHNNAAKYKQFVDARMDLMLSPKISLERLQAAYARHGLKTV